MPQNGQISIFFDGIFFISSVDIIYTFSVNLGQIALKMGPIYKKNIKNTTKS